MNTASENLASGVLAAAPPTPDELKRRVLACKPMHEGWQDAVVDLDRALFKTDSPSDFRRQLIKLRNVYGLVSTDERMTDLIEQVYPSFRK